MKIELTKRAEESKVDNAQIPTYDLVTQSAELAEEMGYLRVQYDEVFNRLIDKLESESTTKLQTF